MIRLGTIALLLLSTTVFAAAVREPFPGGQLITEWDLAFPTEEAMNDYFTTLKSTSLIINTTGPKVYDMWSKTDRMKLTYCVSDAFGENKKNVIEALKVATEDWMDAANVKFIHLKDQDAKCTASNTSVMFDVRPVDIGMYLARAFFPSSKRAERNVLIDESSFSYSHVAFSGFLRHELGHVLGFRHEHISKDSNGACDEGDSNFFPLTKYDQFSVMHYPQCGGKNELENLILSELDKEGVKAIYP